LVVQIYLYLGFFHGFLCILPYHIWNIILDFARQFWCTDVNEWNYHSRVESVAYSGDCTKSHRCNNLPRCAARSEYTVVVLLRLAVLAQWNVLNDRW